MHSQRNSRQDSDLRGVSNPPNTYQAPGIKSTHCPLIMASLIFALGLPSVLL